MQRYSKITKKFPREFILLQGQGCFWKKCTFCDYYLDISSSYSIINHNVIRLVTGEFGVLDVINSGSAMELDVGTLNFLAKICEIKNIHTIWFEAHWNYHNFVGSFKRNFQRKIKKFVINVKFRTGIETFHADTRKKFNKGISNDVSPQDVHKYFDGVCLLAGVNGQKFDIIKQDIGIASEIFEYFSFNVFTQNSKKNVVDEYLILRLKNEVFPQLIVNPKAELLVKNFDLGVGNL
ncbi:MAG: radical SAM protein [Candidatus Improbicoccus devescovinae]|nr:MAG: radical SAM protein [Candidatus Improbicoccus devescovinae]